MLTHPSQGGSDLVAPEVATPFRCPCVLTSPSRWLQALFSWNGAMIARHPVAYIIACLVLSAASGLGLAHFQWENNIIKLWNPPHSETGRNFQWLWKNHPPDLRIHSLIFKAKPGHSVLTPASMQQMLDIHAKIQNTGGLAGYLWTDSCLKVPVVPANMASFLKPADPAEDEEQDDDLWSSDASFIGNRFKEPVSSADPSVNFYPEPYCSVVRSLRQACFLDSILELFGFEGHIEPDAFANMSQDAILHRINGEQISEMFLVPKNFTSLLGGLQLDSAGRVVGADSTIMFLYSRMNVSEWHLQNIRQQSFLGEQLSIEQLDANTKEMENRLIRMLLDEQQRLSSDADSNLQLEFMVAKSFPDTVNQRITSSIPKVVGSFVIMFFYVCICLGKMDCVYNRVYLSMMGLTSILLAMITSYGLCSALGFYFSPLHNFIPFLLLGLGVDDMFVIVQMWDRMEKEDSDWSDLPMHQQFARVMERSGVAITVTSLTDLLAFAVGGTTSLPALKSFCLFCGIGITSVYVYQANWFVAWMVLDQRRRLANRNALIPCVKHQRPDEQSEAEKGCGFQRPKLNLKLMVRYGGLLRLKGVKAAVGLVTVAFLMASLYGNYELEEEFDPWLFVPADSYVRKWKSAQDQLFPSKGEQVIIFVSGPDRWHWSKLNSMVTMLNNQTDILSEVDSWFFALSQYWIRNFQHSTDEPDFLRSATGDVGVLKRLVQFLFSPSGARYRFMFDTDQQIECGQAMPDSMLSMMSIRHRQIHGSKDGILAMNRIKAIIRSVNFQSGLVFPFSPFYSILEIDEIIRSELHRNVGLAVVSIYIATIVLLSDFKASVFVLVCVVMTLSNVSGFMHFLGLRIDTVTSTIIIVCIGLSVDFSAHVVHCFMHQVGPDLEVRVSRMLQDIGPAVLHGGLSTFLAVVLLSTTDVYVMATFFKIFVLVISFGLFNGLVFLPVALSIMGPRPSAIGTPAAADAGPGQEMSNQKSTLVDEEP